MAISSLMGKMKVVTGLGLLVLSLRPLDAPASSTVPLSRASSSEFNTFSNNGSRVESILAVRHVGERPCKTVEEMGEDFGGGVGKESLRVRRIIQNHFLANGASRVRDLPPEQFCRHGFVLGKASEAGFGNEMYKVLTAAALSIMLNRSLIISQTRHIEENILLETTFLIPTLLLRLKKSSICGDTKVVKANMGGNWL
ncbi:hypothetical protein GmHk_02G003564 [Glycine max]|nr:hypothetical protein GmHk_02G003564 [Glycine max]